MTITEIIELTRKYARARAKLHGRCMLIQRAINRLKAVNLPYLRANSVAVRTAEDDLYRAIDGHRELFDKPKTIVVDDIKVGLRKQKGTMSWDDDEKVLCRIKKLFLDRADVFIHVKETPNKTELSKLTGAELKALGITITADTDVVVISSAESDAEKLAMLFIGESPATEEGK